MVGLLGSRTGVVIDTQEGASRLCDVIILRTIFSRVASRLESKFDLTSRRAKEKLRARRRENGIKRQFRNLPGSSKA